MRNGTSSKKTSAATEGKGEGLKLTVGVSILPKSSSGIWNNGINQNIAFLLELLSKSPAIGKVYLINAGAEDSLPKDLQFEGLDISLAKTDELTHEIDLVIEMGTLLDTRWLRHIRALGTKIVTFQVGHTFANNGESMVFNRNIGLTFEDPHLRDEIWILPKSSKTDAPMLRTLTRRPVVEMPHLWSPRFLDQRTKELRDEGLEFGFRPEVSAAREGGWRVGIFEPNISVVKTCFLPMLVCEEAYRKDKSSVGTMMVFNSFQMKEHATFKHFALNLSLVKEQRAWFEGRHVFADAMVRQNLDAVVSHHWDNGQNYLYYDALHGGYPLIHNSEFLRDADLGFFYPDFRAGTGASRYLEARGKEPGYWEDYRKKSAEYLGGLSPQNEANIKAFTDRILTLTAS